MNRHFHTLKNSHWAYEWNNSLREMMRHTEYGRVGKNKSFPQRLLCSDEKQHVWVCVSLCTMRGKWHPHKKHQVDV
jgi:hypothetical protein